VLSRADLLDKRMEARFELMNLEKKGNRARLALAGPFFDAKTWAASLASARNQVLIAVQRTALALGT